MNRFRIPYFLAIGALVAIVIIGCTGGSDDPIVLDADSRVAEVFISLGEPEIDGDEIEYPVILEGVKDIKAMSFRIGFDPDGMEPVGYRWSHMVRNDDATFCLMNRHDFVPFSFARMSKMSGLNTDGEFCRLRFRIRNHERIRAWLVDDPGYLVVKNSLNQRLRMRVRGEGR
ncbi:MAG TPA: hypothetical protein ENN67_08470 [Firmicutes bacterium]|nr:hypothetical protein [Bacillota bacterium]